MPLFSRRKGIRELVKVIQLESMDDELRNRLWTAITSHVLLRSECQQVLSLSQTMTASEQVATRVWTEYLKLPRDSMPRYLQRASSAYEEIRRQFFSSEWWWVYDFVEFLTTEMPSEWREGFAEEANAILESENAAYRLVASEIVEITSGLEIQAIEDALATPCHEASKHLARGLELLSDKKNRDYRNSIKESISAVESVCRAIAGSPKASLGGCLKTISEKGRLHPAMRDAFLKLYGFTSDEGGIRHSLTEQSLEPGFSEAKFMLVASSAFVSFAQEQA